LHIVWIGITIAVVAVHGRHETRTDATWYRHCLFCEERVPCEERFWSLCICAQSHVDSGVNQWNTAMNIFIGLFRSSLSFGCTVWRRLEGIRNHKSWLIVVLLRCPPGPSPGLSDGPRPHD
jgi:hypothetical protein